MKKLILLLSVFALVFTSCSSDDDGGNSQDPFIGSWKYSEYLEDGVSVPLMDCEDLTTVIVSSNGTFSTTSYWDFGNGCEVDYLATGTWENLGSSVYSTTEDGDTFTQEISFDGNEMYFDFIDEGVIYTDVFVRL